MIISFINQKGGVGKSTLAFNFAGYFSRKKKNKVMLIDCDPQQSIFNLLLKRDKKIPFDYISENTINKDDYANYDYVLVDCGGYDSQETRNILQNSDIVIIPTLLSKFDIGSSKHILDILKRHDALGFKTKNFIVRNMVSGKEKENEPMTNELKESVKGYPVTILDSYLAHSVEYNKALGEDESIFENEKTSPSKNTQRFKKMILEVIGHAEE